MPPRYITLPPALPCLEPVVVGGGPDMDLPLSWDAVEAAALVLFNLTTAAMLPKYAGRTEWSDDILLFQEAQMEGAAQVLKAALMAWRPSAEQVRVLQQGLASGQPAEALHAAVNCDV